jgi:hypothetical protein
MRMTSPWGATDMREHGRVSMYPVGKKPLFMYVFSIMDSLTGLGK